MNLYDALKDPMSDERYEWYDKEEEKKNPRSDMKYYMRKYDVKR